jgi:Fur family peroxide stress response transcriptional regulator
MEKMLNANAQAVLDVVRSTQTHPTALEVYTQVRRQRPHIGLASVYRILHQLVKRGEILELSSGDEGSRYDGHIVRHDHAICRSCGALLDIPVAVAISQEALREAADTIGLLLESHEVRLYGYCTSCQTNQHTTFEKNGPHFPHKEIEACH